MRLEGAKHVNHTEGYRGKELSKQRDKLQQKPYGTEQRGQRAGVEGGRGETVAETSFVADYDIKISLLIVNKCFFMSLF